MTRVHSHFLPFASQGMQAACRGQYVIPEFAARKGGSSTSPNWETCPPPQLQLSLNLFGIRTTFGRKLDPRISYQSHTRAASIVSLLSDASVLRAAELIRALTRHRAAHGRNWNAGGQKLFIPGLQRGRPSLDDRPGPPRRPILRRFELGIDRVRRHYLAKDLSAFERGAVPGVCTFIYYPRYPRFRAGSVSALIWAVSGHSHYSGWRHALACCGGFSPP